MSDVFTLSLSQSLWYLYIILCAEMLDHIWCAGRQPDREKDASTLRQFSKWVPSNADGRDKEVACSRVWLPKDMLSGSQTKTLGVSEQVRGEVL